jgi:fatty acid desaturase
MQAQVLRQLAAQLKTYIRGVALPGEKPLFIVTPPMVFAGTLTGLAISLTATQLLVSHLGAYSLPFLPVLLALGQSAVAYLLMLNHQAAHGAIHQDKRINKAVAKISTVLSLGPAPNQYQERHLREHHVPRFLATERDPDYQFLFACGFIPGKSLNYYWAPRKITNSQKPYGCKKSRLRGGGSK